MAANEQLTDRSQAQAPIPHGEKYTNQSEREERVDPVPHIPYTGIHGVTSYPIGAGATDTGAGNTGCNQEQAHATAPDCPVIRALTASGQINTYQRDHR